MSKAHGMEWTPRDVAQLTEMYAKRCTFAEIGHALGRTPSAIASKVTELRLKRPRTGNNGQRPWSIADDKRVIELKRKDWRWESIGKDLSRTAKACKMRWARLQKEGLAPHNPRPRGSAPRPTQRALIALHNGSDYLQCRSDDDAAAERIQRLGAMVADNRPRDADTYSAGCYRKTVVGRDYWWDPDGKEWIRSTTRQLAPLHAPAPPAYRHADSGKHWQPPLPADLEHRPPAVYLGGDLRDQTSHVPPDFPVQRFAPGESSDPETSCRRFFFRCATKRSGASFGEHPTRAYRRSMAISKPPSPSTSPRS
jgi:hypothetical protein